MITTLTHQLTSRGPFPPGPTTTNNNIIAAAALTVRFPDTGLWDVIFPQTSQCSLLEQKRLHNKAMIDPELLKCANCGEKHTASFTGCVRMQPAPTRQNYWINKRPNATVAAPPPPSANLNDNNSFPNLPQRGLKHNQQFVPNVPTFNVSSAQSNSLNNLFSLQELQKIMQEILINLKNCKSKEDQFNLMFSLAAKYVYSP